MAEQGKDYTIYSSIMGQKLYSKFLGPTKNFRANWAYDMPQTIDPESWKAISPEEQKAHNERQAIRGRLRREFWTKKYHPVNWKYFNPVTSDPMYAKFQKARSVYFMRDAFKPASVAGARTIFKVAFFAMVAPMGLFCYIMYDGMSDSKHASALDPRVNY